MGKSLGLPVFFVLSLLLSSCQSTVITLGSNASIPKTIVITGINDYSGVVLVTLSTTPRPAESVVAVGEAAISNKSVTTPLVIPGQEDTRWTGNGDYFIVLVLEENESDLIYYYSVGGMSPFRYNITEAITSIEFSRFRRSS